MGFSKYCPYYKIKASLMQSFLTTKFFERSATKVAPDLLGKFLVRRLRGKKIALMITEVEAYHGFKDRASHASKGLTQRNKIMFGEAGNWYVYFIYGMYWMLNIVTGDKSMPSAVLIRGVKEFNGPGKLTKTLRINKYFNGKTANKKTGLWIEDRGVKIGNPPSRKASEGNFRFLKTKIKKGPRIGVDYAGPVWSKKQWRFYLEGASHT